MILFIFLKFVDLVEIFICVEKCMCVCVREREMGEKVDIGYDCKDYK